MTAIRRRGEALLREWFSVDVRALAALRVALALLILFDVATRVWLLPDFYTDSGVVPRWLASYGLPAVHVSLHMLSGGIAWTAALHALLAAAAASLLVGWHTRTATAVTWLLLVSLHLRNGYVLDAGDRLAHQLLFWCMFLPLGRVYSLDARRKAPSGNPVVGTVVCWAGAALVLQVAAVYLTAGLGKLHGDAWLNGTAVGYAIGQDLWVRAAGVWLQDRTVLTAWLTYAVLAVEIVGPFTWFSLVHGRRMRLVGLGAFLLLQLGMALSIDLRLFPFFMTAALLPLVPSGVWDALYRGLGRRSSARETERVEIRSVERRIPAVGRAGSGFIAAALAFVVWANVATVSRVAMPSAMESAARAIGMDQGWGMYSPSPFQYNARLTIAGLRSDSTQAVPDDWGESASWRPLERFRGDYRSKSYLEHLAQRGAQLEFQALAEWVCRTWNGSHQPSERFIAITIVKWEQEIRLDGSSTPPDYAVLPEQECF